MKNLLAYQTWVVILVLIAAASCSRQEFFEPLISSDNPISVSETKPWVERFVKRDSNATQRFSNHVFIWKQAVVKQLPNRTSYVQVPLAEAAGGKRVIVDPTTKAQIPAPLLQAIIHKDVKGEFQIRVMELTPDAEYTNLHPGFTGDADYTGMQLLWDWAGKVVGGNRYEKGKVVGRVMPNQAGSPNARKMQYCEDWLRQYIYIGCTNRYNETTVVGTVLYYRLGTYPPTPQRPNEVAPGSYISCDVWQNGGGPEYFQICTPDPTYDPFNPSNPSNPSNPFSPLTGSGATALLELYNNKKALFGPCPGLTDSWRYQIDHRATTAVKDKLNRLATFSPFNQGLFPSYPNVPQDWYVQSISSAVGTLVNLDNFSVFMDDLPIVDGRRLSLNEFAEYVRLHINDFVDTSLSSFSPHPLTGENEAGLWGSNYATGAVILINIPGDAGSVIVTEHHQGQESAGWTFATIHDAFVQDHPVSGVRTFSIYETAGGYMFNTQGADRLTNYLGHFAQQSLGIPFDQADALWISMQNKMYQFLTTHGAQPQILQPVRNRPKWDDVKRALDENRSLSTLPCN
ncbi:hypothetical protein [Spirosoma sordidisoli]|uniref:Uncharacterized protein n=1 Tax=Spirosoma sordidisoli TaxID=2502893 RepID=A0A4Q2UC97_9BACT|nr:hypothetical protein [Spirosoma sordidisoli]RYC66627.1 hypothetical protein EQG79_28975 [Spirosoma sordidisoli]